ncbi:MAG: T9SS type A sorting domain-containing protein [Saprospiraceae bacterium]|nr:T9SS type A sorting domain-containing protein [Saprospiraceae bacterium]
MTLPTFEVNIINNSQQANRNIRAFINVANSEFAEFVIDPDLDFNCITTIPGSRTEFRIVNNVSSDCNAETTHPMEPNDTKTFRFKVRYKGGLQPDASGGIKSFRVSVYTGTLTPPPAAIANIDIKPFLDINGGNFSNLVTNGQWANFNPLFIKGDLIMNLNNVPGAGNFYDFAQNGKLLFASGRGLTIANIKTTMVGVDVRGCDNMWKGITVNNGSEFVSDMTTIEDAQSAILAKRGSIVTVQNSNLLNNNFAIRTDPAGTGNFNLTLNGNRYGTTTNLKSAYGGQSPAPTSKGFAGIYLENAGSVALGTSFEQANEFFNLHYGIISNNTDLTVRNASFQDIEKTAQASGYGAFANAPFTGKAIQAAAGSLDVRGNIISTGHPVVFNNCHTGIQTTNTGVQLWECVMLGVANGIIANGGISKPYYIAWNNITASDRGISTFYQSGLSGQSNIEYNTVRMMGNAKGIGIGVGGQEMFPQYEGFLLGNTVTMDDGDAGIHVGVANRLRATRNYVHLNGATVPYGIRMEGGDRNTLNCNTITNPGSGDNAALYAVHPARASILCNTADGTARGLHFEGMLAGKAKADVAGNTMKNNPAAGLLLGTDAVLGPQAHRGNKFEGVGAMAGAGADDHSKFTVDANENPDFLPFPLFLPSWFLNTADPAPSYQCVPGTSCPLPAIVSDYALDIKIVKGELGGTTYQAANQWLAQRRFYELVLEEGNPYPGNSDVSAFLSQAQTNGISVYANVQVGIRSLGAMTEPHRVVTAGNLLALNGTLADSAVYQANEKSVNQIFLQTLALGNTDFNESQITVLQGIAEGCPLSDGEAVLRARAMLEVTQGSPVIYDDLSICGEGERSVNKKMAGQTSLHIYPNPANDLLNIDYRSIGNTDVQLLIFNSQGQIVRQVSLQAEVETVQLSLQNIPVGVYWYVAPGVGLGKFLIQR